MKKVILTALFSIILASCSTDDSSELLNDAAAINENSDYAGRASAERPRPVGNACFETINTSTDVNWTGGLGGSAAVTFYAMPQGGVNGNFNVRLEIETLADCEDVNGPVTASYIAWSGNVTDPNVNTTAVTLQASDLPYECYRWRFVFERKATSQFIRGCTMASGWMEAPLF